MSDEDLFGPIITGADVEDAVLASLQKWTPTYLAWVERKAGRPPRTLPEPRSWITSTSLDRWPEQSLPSVLLLSTGLADEPDRDGRASYRAKFALGLAVVVSARDRRESDELAKLYTAVFRAVLLHHPGLDGFAEGVEWVDEKYDALPGDAKSKRQLAAGQGVYRIDVREVVGSRRGPSEPLPDPYDPYPDTVIATEVTVEVEGVAEVPVVEE